MNAQGFTPRYRLVAADLKQRLAGGEWAVQDALPSSRALAQHYGLSRPMILRVLKELAREGLIALAGRTLPRVSAPTAVTSLMRESLAVVLSSTVDRVLRNPYSGRALEGIFGATSATGHTLVVLQHRNQWRTVFPAGLDALQVGGVLLLGPFSPPILRRYETLNLPVVLLDQPGEKFRLHSVGVDNYQAAYDATVRLIALGHRRLAFVRYVVVALKDIDPDARERELGFVHACRDAKIPASMQKIFTCYGTKQAVRGLIDKSAGPSATGILTASAEIALAVKKRAELHHLSIPRDLSICTFDHSQPTVPDWSGPRIDFRTFGQRAVELLARRPATHQHVRIPAPWHDGATVGPARR